MVLVVLIFRCLLKSSDNAEIVLLDLVDIAGDVERAALHLLGQCLGTKLLREVIGIAHDPLDFLGIFSHQIEFAL